MTSEQNTNSVPLFPRLTSQDIIDCQFSSWYPKFAHVSIKSTTIKPLPSNFVEYLQADRLFAPKGSNDHDSDSEGPAQGDDDSDDSEPDLSPGFAFPELDQKIRRTIGEYGAVFPKMNWSSPKDAQWILSTTDFMRCTTPADVYLTLKASDFIQHDIDPSLAFEGVQYEEQSSRSIDHELTLRKWYPVDRSRELRCFVREGVLLGISQREMIFYDFLTSSDTQKTVKETARSFWERELKDKWRPGGSYVFDILLTRDLKRAHLVDFNPFVAKTDALLFSYEDLHSSFATSQKNTFSPELRIIDSPSHPYANINAPKNQHNMVPLDALALSSGRTAEDLASALAEAVQESNTNRV